MVAYAAGTFVFGALGSREGASPVRLMVLGLAASALLTGIFPAVDLTGWTLSSQMWVLVPLWAANGAAQSSTWPTVVAVMAAWWPRNTRGAIFGLWAGNAMVGDVIGSIGVGWMLGAGLGWQWCFVAGSSAMALTGVALFIWLRSHPPEPADDQD